MLLCCIAALHSRNVRKPDMKFGWRTALSHVKSVFVHPNVCVRSGLRSFFVRTQALYIRPMDSLLRASMGFMEAIYPLKLAGTPFNFQGPHLTFRDPL